MKQRVLTEKKQVIGAIGFAKNKYKYKLGQGGFICYKRPHFNLIINLRKFLHLFFQLKIIQ